MSDVITAKASDAKFKSHQEGQYVAQCVDTIDLGDNVEQYQDQPARLAHKCALVFRTGERNDETGEFIDVHKEFTVSMGEKANLRRFLEQWRGKPYTPEQAEAGVPLHKLTGNYGLVTVANQVSKKGRTYAVINACVGIPKQLQNATEDYTSGYTRAEFWQTKKADYAEAVRKYRAEQAPPADVDDLDESQAQEDADDLPF